VASCSWFDGFCTHHHCISDQGRMAMCGANRRYLEVYRIPKLLYELLFTKLARRTDTGLVMHLLDVSHKLQKLSHSEVFQTLWQKSIVLTLCTQVLEYGSFCYTFCSSKICHLHIECGLSGSPICIGFCHCLQVIIEMYYCSAWYRPV